MQFQRRQKGKRLVLGDEQEEEVRIQKQPVKRQRVMGVPGEVQYSQVDYSEDILQKGVGKEEILNILPTQNEQIKEQIIQLQEEQLEESEDSDLEKWENDRIRLGSRDKSNTFAQKAQTQNMGFNDLYEFIKRKRDVLDKKVQHALLKREQLTTLIQEKQNSVQNDIVSESVINNILEDQFLNSLTLIYPSVLFSFIIAKILSTSLDKIELFDSVFIYHKKVIKLANVFKQVSAVLFLLHQSGKSAHVLGYHDVRALSRDELLKSTTELGLIGRGYI